MKYTLSEIAEILGGELYANAERQEQSPCPTGMADVTVDLEAVCIDSRRVKAGSVFFALAGARVDGHDFIEDVFKACAACAVVNKEYYVCHGGAYIVVEDTLAALQALAKAHRDRIDPKVVGITGSVGKTTTKELCALAVGAKYNTLKTAGNYNSVYGMPMTALLLEPEHEAAVFEMGMNGLGEISVMSAIGRPDVAMITNIGVAHIEFLGSREGILKAKMEIAEGIKPGGVLILNLDDEYLRTVPESDRYRTIWVGIEDERADWRAIDIESTGNGVRFVCLHDGNRCVVEIPVPGMHNVINGLCAIAAAVELGVPMEDAAKALAGFKSDGKRMDISVVRGVTLVNDAYNASPESVRASLDVLAEQACKGKRYAVLSDMLELGVESGKYHREVGAYAAGKVDGLIVYGDFAQDYSGGAVDAGMNRLSVYGCDDAEAAGRLLTAIAEDGDAVLFKGSRGMKCEKVLEVFVVSG